MACVTTTEHYIPVVKNLIKLDSKLYKNYDNVVKFILKSAGLTPEQKKQAIHTIAHIYNGLHGLDNEFYGLGKALDVINSVNLLDETNQYIKHISKIYDIKEPNLPTADNIISKINALGKISLITLADLDPVLQLIKNYSNTHEFADEKEKTEQINQFRAAIKEVVGNMTKADEAYKKVLYESIDYTIDRNNATSPFIPLSTVFRLAQLDNYLLTLQNGKMVEAVLDGETFYKVESDGALIEIAPETIISKKEARPADWSFTNDAKEVFKPDFFLSGLTIDSVNPEEHDQLLKALNNMSSPSSGVKITAVRISDAGDVRLGRIRQVAYEDPQKEGLLKRQHETFENSIQEEYLKSNPDAKVLTVSRPKASEQKFALIGEILETGQKFYIYSMDNYVFVSADNSTEKLDVNNPGHIKLLRETAVKTSQEGMVELSDADITSIIASQKLFSKFKDAVDGKVNDAFLSEDSVDVTDDFLGMYDLSNQRQGPPQLTMLKDAVQKNTQLSKSVNVVKINSATGEIISEEQRNIPIYFTKEVDYKTKEIVYTLVPFLAADERIKLTTADGKVHTVTELVHAREGLGITNEVLDFLFKRENEELLNRVNTNQSLKGASITTNFVIRFMPDGRLSYAIAKPNEQFQFGEYFAKYISMLSMVIKGETKTTALRNFRSLEYDFTPLSVKEHGNVLTFEFATSRVATGSKLQFEIRPFGHKADTRYGNVILKKEVGPDGNTVENKYNYNFSIDEAAVNTIAESLQSSNPIVKKAIDDNPSLASYDLTNADEILKFYSDVFTLASTPNASESILKLVEHVDATNQKFTNLIEESVINKITKNENGIYTDFLDLLKEDLTFESGFEPSAMFMRVDDKNKKILKIISPSKSGRDNTRTTFNRSMKNISILESASRKSFKITAKTATNVRAADQQTPVVDQTGTNMPKAPELVPEINIGDGGAVLDAKQPDPAPDSDSTDNAIEIDPFSIAEGEYRQATPEDLEQEFQWLLENLPQFGLDTKSLKDVIDLTKIDGAVLGMFKDRVIYLNSALPSKGTLYHEAFHGVFRYLLTAPERRQLVNEIISNKKYESRFTQDAINEFAKKRNLSTQNVDTIIELIAEEILADGFQNYMLKEKTTKPKTVLQKFFEMLKKLLDFFMKNKSNIDNLYGKIKSGHYRTATIKSNMFDGQSAFELISGPIRYYKDDKGNNLKAATNLNPTEQNNLINMMVGTMLLDNSTTKFNDKFEAAVDKLLKEVYDIDKIVSQKPELKELIVAKYGDMITKFRFVMGARMKGIPTYDLNYTGDPLNDNKQNVNIIRLINEDKIDNSMGQYSYDRLKALVKDRYTKANAIAFAKANDELTLDKDEVEATFNGETEKNVKDDEKNEAAEELEWNFDEGFGQEDRSIDSYVAQIRRFLSTLRNDFVDTDLGITIPQMVDGQYLFPTLLKITAGIKPENIVSTLGIMADQMIKDGYEQSGRDIKAVYDSIMDLTRPDADGIPQSNKQILNLLVDALHGIELNYVMFNITTPKKLDVNDNSPQTMDEMMRQSSTRFRLYDKVLDTDTTSKRNEIVSNFVKNFSANAESPEFQKALKYLKNFHKEYLAKSIPDILSSIAGHQVKLNDLTEKLHEALTAVGLRIPKSLIELSLLGINASEKNVANQVDPKTQQFYDLNQTYINQLQFLESDFFLDLSYIIGRVTEGAKPNATLLKGMLDDQNAKDANVSRFMLVLKKASNYIIKYDPTNLPPVVKNAEGKSIYRFAKYNPLLQVAQKVNGMSLEDALKDDPYWEHSLKAFINDNPELGAVLRNENTPEAKKTQLFLDNLTIAMFGGVRQRSGDVAKEGQTFKSIDERSLHLLQILAFMNRKTQKDKEGNTITTYFRSFHQLEATQTNFLMSAVHDTYISKSLRSVDNPLGVARYKKNYLKIVETLEGVIKQEYNRIAREWSRRKQVKENYDSGAKNDAVLKYNATLDDTQKEAVTDDPSLRAYNFNVLSDFFALDENKKFKEELIASAKKTDEDGNSKPTPFEDLQTKQLLTALDKYAMSEFQKYMNALEKSELISVIPIPDEASDGDPRPNARKTYYVANDGLLPESIRNEFSNVAGIKPFTSVEEEYPNPTGMRKDASRGAKDFQKAPVETLLFDAFMNNWNNALIYNQLMDGDIALSVKNAQDYVKRLKKIVATGSNMKQGTHTVAYMNTIVGFVHDKYPTYGPYYNRSEIENDYRVTNENLREELLEAFDNGDMMREVFDGQSISTLMHQMDMHNALGRLDDRAINIMIAKHYRALSAEEIKYLESSKIVNNAKKTVTASRYLYHKNSEGYIDRNDVSELVYDKAENETDDEAAQRVYEELHGLYMSIYDERQKIKDLKNIPGTEEDQRIAGDTIRAHYTKLHSYYVPIPHRKMLHDILNSMEMFQVDQIMDTSATKQATLLPIDIFNADRTPDGYINLGLSSIDVPNDSKYLQVETSGVKDKAKHSVQAKVLLPADISEELFRKIIEEEARKTGKLPTESEIQAMINVKNSLNDYQLSLTKATKARLTYFKNVLRKGSDFELGKIYTLIRESLEMQNAPSNILDMFAVKPDGNPVFNSNLSLIRNTLEYYMIAQYSKYVTDEKVSGFKNFHESMFGYNVLEDTQTGEIITTEEYVRNKNKYADATRYKSRPLSVTTEVRDGMTYYYTEAILPKPTFQNKQQEEFYMRNLRKMFGVRIPTEDKRSMIVLKVVDFVDSSKLNNIIVPHYVHMLSGSDFDIDSLFGRMMAYYQNGKNEFSLYGDYSQYTNPEAGQFIEYLHYMSKNSDFAPLIAQRLKELETQDKFTIAEGSSLYDILVGLKFDNKDFAENFNQKQLKSDISTTKNIRNVLFELTSEAKTVWLKAREEAEMNPENRELANTRDRYNKTFRNLSGRRQRYVEQKRFLQNKLRIINAAHEYQAIIDVLSRYNLPISIESFNADPIFKDIVGAKYQNQNLQASMDILSNEAVFKYLYINQRSSVKQFTDMLKMFGIDMKTITQKANLYTPTNMVASKVENNMNKDGIGITAVMNKFLSLASQYELELNDKNIIWRYKDANNNLVVKKNFAQLNEDNQRVVSIIGNILGMFADGAKDPIPAALQMNEINTSTTLAMIGVGLKPEFAMAFNFLPEVRKASLAVQQSKFAISDDINSSYLFYNQSVQKQIEAVVNENPAAFNRLKKLGIINKKTWDIKSGSTWQGRVLLNTDNIKIEFAPGKIDIYALKNNMLSPSAIGFKLKDAETELELTDEEAKIVLLTYYQKQAAQTWKMSRTASVTNLFKRLNPSLTAFDKMRNNVAEIRDASLFTEDSANKLFDENQVYSVLADALDDADEQFSKIFLERTKFFKPVVDSLKGYFENNKTISNTLTSFLALNRYKAVVPGSRKTKNAVMQSIIDQDDKNLLEAFTPEYWFTNTLFAEVEKMFDKYPKNEFLKLLKQKSTDNTATVNINGVEYKNIPETYIQILSKAKIKGEYATKIADSITSLYNQGTVEEKLFVKKLFYHEIVRTGLQNAEGSFISYMPAELKIPLSGYIDDFVNGLQEVSNASKEGNLEENFIKFMKKYIRGNSREEVNTYFDEMFSQLAYAAAMEENNEKIPVVKDSKNAKSFSFYFNSNPKEVFYSKAVVKAFAPADKMDKETLPKAKIEAIKHFAKVFNFTDVATKTDAELEKIYSVDFADLGDEFVMDLSDEETKKFNANKAIAKVFGAKLIEAEMAGQVDVFAFPAMMKMNGKMYVLQGVSIDNEKGSSSTKSIGANFIDSITGKTTFTNEGRVARYKVIPQKYSSEALSPIAFTQQDASKYNDFITKKQAIVVNREIVDTSKEEKADQTTTSDTTNTENTIITDDSKEIKSGEIGNIPNNAKGETVGTVADEGMPSLESMKEQDQMLLALMGMAEQSKKPEENKEVPKLQPGRYVEYIKEGETKSQIYIVTKQLREGLWQIYNPNLEGSKAKIPVAERNLKPMSTLAKIILYNNTEYIVTPKNTIISLQTNKIQEWGDENGNRKNILALADQNRTIIQPSGRPGLDITNENNCGGA